MQQTVKRFELPSSRRAPGLLYAAAAVLLVLAGSCSGGSGTEFDELDSQRSTSAGAPVNLLPPPSSLVPRMGNHPNAACPGDGFEAQLPHHRVSSSGGGALFTPQAGKGKGKGNKNGHYAYALYHVSAPECPSVGEDDDCDNPTLRLSVNPLFEQGGKGGDNPLYVGIADFSSNTWTVRAQDYNSSRSNTTSLRLDDDDDDDSIPTEDEDWLVAVIVGPAAGGGGGGAILVESLSVSSGWNVALLDEGLRNRGILEGSSELDACRAGDGSHHVAFFAGESGLRHVRCADGACRASSIPDSGGSGPNVGMCVSPKGFPHVSSTDSGRGVGPVRWMSPEGLWLSSLYSSSEPGEAFDPRWSSDVVVSADGREHVVQYNPLSSGLVHFSRSHGGDWKGEVIARELRIRQRPDLLVSEWDSLVSVCRTSGSGGAVYVYQRGAAGWHGKRVADAPCPEDGVASPRCSLGADLDRDGRLDIVCSTSRGDIAIHHSLRDGSTEVSSLGPLDEASRCASVVSHGGVMHSFLYIESSGEVRYIRKRPGRTTYSMQTVARYAPAVAGVEGHVTVLKAVLDPDSDGDGFGDVSCYILESSSSTASGDARHWTLEVRVNRIEMA